MTAHEAQAVLIAVHKLETKQLGEKGGGGARVSADEAHRDHGVLHGPVEGLLCVVVGVGLQHVLGQGGDLHLQHSLSVHFKSFLKYSEFCVLQERLLGWMHASTGLAYLQRQNACHDKDLSQQRGAACSDARCIVRCSAQTLQPPKALHMQCFVLQESVSKGGTAALHALCLVSNLHVMACANCTATKMVASSAVDTCMA